MQVLRLLPTILYSAILLGTSLSAFAADTDTLPPDRTVAASEGSQLSLLQAELAQYEQAIATEQADFVALIARKDDTLSKLREALDSISTANNRSTGIQLSQNYANASSVWEAAVDNILEQFSGIQLQFSVEFPELVAQHSLNSDSDRAGYRGYLASYQELKARTLKLAQEKTLLLDNLKTRNFSLLNDAGSLRASLLKACDLTPGCDRPRGFNSANLNDTLRELRAVPLRAEAGVVSKGLEVKAKVKSGLDGWLDLLTQSFVLAVIIAIPFLLRRILLWATQRLDSFRRAMLARSMLDPRYRTLVAMSISRLNPFIPSLGMILSVHVAQMLIETTDLRVISTFLTYLLIYFYYQATRLVLSIGLEVAFSTHSVTRLKEQKIEIERSSRRISALVFIEYALLQLIEDTVRTGLIHNLALGIIFWVNVIFVLVESQRWREVISGAFAYRHSKLWKHLQPYYTKRLGSLLSPLLFAEVVAHDLFKLVSSRLVKLDFMKQLLSELFRRRLDQASKDTPQRIEPPPEYLAVFDYYLPARNEFFISRDSSVIIDTQAILAGWLAGNTSDDLVVIVGDRGMGKTTILKKLHDEVAEPNGKHLFNIPARTLNSESLYDRLTEMTGHPIRNLADFSAFDRAQTRKVVFFVDEIHNLFLSCIGGFAAYRLFIELINLKTRNIFWCLTINARSWSYLKGVFGEEHFYGRVLSIPAWQDYEIQRLILARHDLSGYRRTFDATISAYAGGDGLGQQAETQFFRMLWGQSRGNPRSALMYWMSAISAPDTQHIHVGVPAFVNANVVSTMSDDALFMLAAIARHESLSLEELSQTTEIHNTVLRRNLKEASDKELVWLDPQERVRISSRAQYVIDYFLIGKNFLHE